VKLRLALYVTITAALMFEARAFLPYPNDYVTRLQYLTGWASRGHYGFNCSALITNAHGDSYLTEREFWTGAHGRVSLVAEFADRYQIDEQQLHAGDVAVFQGPTASPYLGRGLHVAAYLGKGTWIDSDTRRGFVAQFPLIGVPDSDPWFKGKVRIVRWNRQGSARWHLTPVAENFFVTNARNDYRLQDDLQVTERTN
jgi:hypothetical protein